MERACKTTLANAIVLLSLLIAQKKIWTCACLMTPRHAIHHTGPVRKIVDVNVMMDGMGIYVKSLPLVFRGAMEMEIVLMVCASVMLIGKGPIAPLIPEPSFSPS